MLHADVVADCSQAREVQLRLYDCSEIIAGEGLLPTVTGAAPVPTPERTRTYWPMPSRMQVHLQQAPAFKEIANTPGMSITALTVWSRTSHSTMPNLVIDSADMDNLVAYILSL